MNKTNHFIEVTKEDFLYFKERCFYWRNILGLHEWELYFEFKNIPNCQALIEWEKESKQATVVLSTQTPKSASKNKRLQLDSAARHELMHLFFVPFVSMLNVYYDTSYTTGIEHGLIHKIETAFDLLQENNRTQLKEHTTKRQIIKFTNKQR